MTTKIFSLVFLLAVLSVSARAQFPPIGIIDIYGLRSVKAEQISRALEIKEGDELSASREAIEKRLASVPGVAQADVSAVCCDDGGGKTMLYVGIQEKGSPVLKFRPAPTGAVRLTDEMMKAADELGAAVQQAALKGDVAEDDSAGHALFKNSKARAVQLRFIEFAATDFDLLRRVLRESANVEHRATAAQIIAYAPDKRRVVRDLVAATNDPDDSVRNNAMRALGVIAEYALGAPQKRIKVPFEPFVRMLNSVEWSDRNKSSLALLRLTAARNPKLLAELRRGAMPALVEMTRWKNPGHANAPFFILGRVAGLPENEIQRIWLSGDRNALLTKRIVNHFQQNF